MKRKVSFELIVILLVSFIISFEVSLSAKGETSTTRLLLNYYSGGEQLGGAFSRQDFESYFSFVGYYNTIPAMNEWEAFDVVCTNLLFPLSQEEIDAFRSFLSDGGGLIILRGGNDSVLKQIDVSFSNDGRVYDVLGGIVVTNVEYMLAVGGVFNNNFYAFLNATTVAGNNKIGDRNITPKEYYGNDITLQGNRIDMIVDQSRASAYETDIPFLENCMANMENFLGFAINRRITVSVRPVALEFGVFAFGASNNLNHVAFSQLPGHLDVIFRHECAHIYEYEFNQRYFFNPAFGEGIIGEAGIDGETFSKYVSLLIIQPRSVHLFGALINKVNVSEMAIFFNSLNQYDKNLIPTKSYWDSIYIYPEDETEYLKRSSSIINFYFSRAYGQNFFNVIKSWGVNEVVDYAPIFFQLNQTEQLYSQNPDVPGASSKRYDMWYAFYGGDFQSASTISEELQSILNTTPTPSPSPSPSSVDSFPKNSPSPQPTPKPSTSPSPTLTSSPFYSPTPEPQPSEDQTLILYAVGAGITVAIIGLIMFILKKK